MSSSNGAKGSTGPAVAAEGIGKRYELGETASIQRTLRALRPSKARAWKQEHSLQALRDISFSIDWGEAYTFVGANGSGKSTLAGILSGLIEPTTGQVTVPERTIPVLGLSPGLHPEMKGTENVYQYSIALGYTPDDIEEVMDKVLDFSELSKAHMNTPIKRFSSGMRTRLTVSVVLNLPSDLLIFDEVLAKADTAFKGRCIERITDLVAEGRTIIYIGHEMELIRNLCTRGLWLEEGELKQVGDVEDIVLAYAASAVGADEIARREGKNRERAEAYAALAQQAAEATSSKP